MGLESTAVASHLLVISTVNLHDDSDNVSVRIHQICCNRPCFSTDCPLLLVLEEAGTLVEINAQHDDTSISMNACVVCSQDDAHIAQTDTYSDRASESASYQCNAQPPSAAQLKTADSNVQNQQQLQTHQQALPNAIPTYEASFSALVSMSSQTEAAPCAASEITMPSTSNEGMHDNLAEPGASPNRLLMLADADRAGQYERAVQHVVAGAGPEAVCITSGAGPRLALMAATCDNVQQVICLQVRGNVINTCCVWSVFAQTADIVQLSYTLLVFRRMQASSGGHCRQPKQLACCTKSQWLMHNSCLTVMIL